MGPGADGRVARRAFAVVLVAMLAAGCAAGPARDATLPAAKTQPRKAVKPEVAAPVASDWESFTNCRAALAKAIEGRADAMKSGPVGAGATELASLRLAASSRDLIDSGSLAAARQSLQRAVSLWGSNGWAYLWLGYVSHVEGKAEQAAEFTAKARRHLPREAGVTAEVDGLAASIRQAAS